MHTQTPSSCGAFNANSIVRVPGGLSLIDTLLVSVDVSGFNEPAGRSVDSASARAE